jgi:hypothetical protein
LPTPLVNLRFSEGTGATTINSGSLGGEAVLVQPDGSGLPVFTNFTPGGVFAPVGNTSSLDLGAIAAGQFGRSVDLTTTGGDGTGTLGSLTNFTICGWLNARALTEGPGGNRIAFALDAPNGSGFDLVQLANGSLRIGINQWPDGANGGGPASSTGIIKADPEAGSNNWVFFAVAYDPNLAQGNLKYYFGSVGSLAGPDTAHDYKGLNIGLSGEMPATGPLSVGNFGNTVGARNDTGGGSRVFRGLVDDLRVYAETLDLAGIQEAQLNGALPPVPVTITKQPASATVFADQAATFSVQVNGAAPFTYQWQRGTVDIAGETSNSYTLPSAASGDNAATFRVRVSNPVTPAGIFSDPATLTVLPESGHKISLSFSDGGTTVTNLGNLGGTGVYLVNGTYPAASGNIPTGAFAPGNNISSVDFGSIAAGQGGRAVDLAGGISGSGVGPMKAFTLTGWLNCRNLQVGPGGNRVLCAHAFGADPGFDLVQNDDGTLQLGVNSWADWPAAGPRSSAQKVTADPAAGGNNWVFFAVTYDGTLGSDNLNYYFGSPSQAAALDVAATYAQGVFTSSGAFTVGNLNPADGARNATGGDSRCFRGLIDEVQVFNKALSLSEVQAVQVAPAYRPVTVESVSIQQSPQSLTVFEGQDVTFVVSASGTPPLSYQWWIRHAGTDTVIQGANTPSYSLSQATLSNSADEFWVVTANASSTATSARATLTVLAENNHKVALSFSEGSGTTTANLGNIGGSAALVQANNLPVFTNVVPVGTFAPANNTSAVEFGAIGAGEGGRAIDLTTSVTPNIGPMKAFTLTGWLNSRDLAYGWGGNRILYCQASPGSGGFDLVQEADGVLWMGVNSWPDWPQPVSTAKSSPRITADPSAGNANWVFFAVTYDGTISAANVSFYFGSPTEAAAVDVTVDYDKGPVNSVGSMSVGNFSTVDMGARAGTGSQDSRCFRGLMDELNVFNKVLTIAEIQAVQKAPAGTVLNQPQLTIRRSSDQVVIAWDSPANFQLQYRDLLTTGTWTDEPTPPVVNGTQKSVTLATTGPTRFYRLINR